MGTICIIVFGGVVLLYLDTIKREIDEIKAEQEHQDKAIVELLEHIAGAAEAVKNGRRCDE